MRRLCVCMCGCVADLVRQITYKTILDEQLKELERGDYPFSNLSVVKCVTVVPARGPAARPRPHGTHLRLSARANVNGPSRWWGSAEL